jgi:23S rRNA (uracil1939-C5)-methyltransferase
MQLELSIDRMAYGSDAVARTSEGKTVFVEGAVAGDRALVDIVEEGKRFDRGRVAEVLDPSPDRVAPLCPYAGVCGGCPWAHVDYAAQLSFKRANVTDALVRLGHMDANKAETLVEDCAAPGDAWGYRNKVELGCRREGGRLEIGMYRERSKRLVRVDACLLQEPKYAKTLKAVRGAVSYLSGSQDLGIERIGIRGPRRAPGRARRSRASCRTPSRPPRWCAS